MENKESIKKIFYKTLYILLLVISFAYVFFQLRYSVISNDDMEDFICYDLTFYHGRYFTTLFQYLVIKVIPDFLKINYQEFALISQAFLKSLFLIFTTSTISNTITFFQKQKNYCILCITYIVIFFLFFSLLYNLQFIFGIEISEFFYGYIFPIPFFVIFLNMTFKYFYLRTKISDKNLVIYLLLLLFIISSNEEYGISAVLILSIIFIKELLLGRKSKLQDLLICICVMIGSMICFYSDDGFQQVVSSYELSIINSFSLECIRNFLIAVYDRLILNISFLWIILILTIFIYIDKARIKKSNRIKSIFSYIKIINIAFISFFFGLFLLGETFPYENYKYYHLLPHYWILHPGLLICYYSIVITNILFIISYKQRKLKEYNKKSLIILFILYLIIGIKFVEENFEITSFSDYKRKEILYIADKLSVFYFSRNKTAVLPRENIELILPIYQNSMPKDLEDKTGNAYKGKIYNDILYFKYLKNNYKVDTSAGCMFTDMKTALENYKEEGGVIKENELNKLNFKNIKNEFR